MSAEAGPQKFLDRHSIEAAWAEDLAMPAAGPVPPAPASRHPDTLRREQLEKRYGELERRYQELYAVYERVLKEQDEERSRLKSDLIQADEDIANLREELRTLQENRPSQLATELARIDETLAQIRAREADLFRKVAEVHQENDALAVALKKVRATEARAQIDQARAESRLQGLAEVLLKHSLSLSATQELVQQSLTNLRSLLQPLQGELARGQSPLAKGLLRDLEDELKQLTDIQARLQGMGADLEQI